MEYFLLQMNGKGSPSMASKLLERNTDANGQVSDESLIAKTVGTTYAGSYSHAPYEFPA